MNILNPRWIFPFTIGLIAFAFIYIGLRGLVKRKPFLISTRWIFFIMIPIFLPGLLLPFTMHNKIIDLGLMTWAGPLLMILFFVFYWKMTQGYLVYGASDVTIRKAILSTLEQLKLAHSENMTGIHLTSQDITLTASVVLSLGQIRAKGKSPGKILKSVAEVLNRELAKPETEFDLKPFLFYLGVGVIFLILGFSEIFLLQHLGLPYVGSPQ